MPNYFMDFNSLAEGLHLLVHLIIFLALLLALNIFFKILPNQINA